MTKTEIAGKEQATPGAELVAQGHTIIKLENDVQMSFAIMHPRDNEAILAEALKVLDLSPILASSAIYSKPVGRDERNVMKYAEGLSIRAAEELRRIYGNNSAGVSYLGERGDEVVIGAVFLDMEKNTRFAGEKGVSKFFKNRNGQIVQHPPDRLQDIVIPANQSKLLREVILRSLPAWLKAEFENKARDIQSKGKLPALRKKMVAAFSQLTPPVSEEMILHFLERDSIDKISREEIQKMKGVHTAIIEGEQSVTDVFGPPPEKEGEKGEKGEKEKAPLTGKGKS